MHDDTMTGLGTGALDGDLEAELARFEAEERARLGLAADGTAATSQWTDANPNRFGRDAKTARRTTILHGGLTYAQDIFTQAALRGIGYKAQALAVPDQDALQFGREYGNRGQCNPTYFTVGNLVKHLTELKAEGKTPRQIADDYVFVTAGACGPCRFGTYVTEYRKALRDAGFDGFRVLLFQQSGGIKQATGDDKGFPVNPKFVWALVRALLCGDALNALMYRIRPYEVEAGATDRAVEKCREIICAALEHNTSLVKALVQCRRLMGAVKVDRTVVKPKVGIIGEFWAMTTEGDGNYKMQRFLESEGAEVDVQLVTAWLLYMIWQAKYDTEQRAELRGADGGRFGLKNVNVGKKLATLAAADRLVRAIFQGIANTIGLHGYHLPDMDELAEVSHAFYDNNLRGGEGHMEVGKLILNVAKSKVNMTLSVKPFGCMPSSSVSDGVQSLITEMYPDGIFLPVETNGDGAVNVQSRVQMQLFKAKQVAQREVDRQLAKAGMTMEEVRAYLAKTPHLASALHKAPHVAGCTAADVVAEIAQSKHPLRAIKESVMELWNERTGKTKQASLAGAARAAAEKLKRERAAAKIAAAIDPLTMDIPLRAKGPAPDDGKKRLPVV